MEPRITVHGVLLAAGVALVAACRSADASADATSTSTVTASGRGDPSPESSTPGDATAAAQVQRLIARFQSGQMPSYPPAAQRLGEEGCVEVVFAVRDDGGVDDLALVVSSGSPRLDEAVLTSARTWRFHPRTGAGGVERVRPRVVFALDD